MKIWILPVIMSMLAFGCATTGVTPTPEKTQLQIREFQTRMYDTNDIKMVMKSMLNVLQDDGFIVKNAVMDLGLLSAEKSIDVEKLTESDWAKLAEVWRGIPEVWWIPTKEAFTYIIECTANISEFGKQTRVRVNFQGKVLNYKGGIVRVRHIDNEEYYQEFFSKVDKEIFIQKEKL